MAGYENGEMYVKIDIDGNQINYELEGPEDAPCITFSHALCNNLTLWDEQAALLRDRFRVLRYDQRGHGQSDAPAGPYSFPALMHDAVALWDALDIAASHWVGLSIGGMIGYGLAQDHGGRLLSLTACDSRPDAPPDYQVYFQYRIDTARDKGMEGLVEPTIERWFTPATRAANPPVLDKVRAMIRATNPVGHAGCCEALKTLAFGSRLGEIGIPTLIIGGEADKGAPPSALAETAHAIPGARLVVVPDAGHISNLENPAAFNRALAGFLDRL
jgi:3-oxoadipate enol-lactonase